MSVSRSLEPAALLTSAFDYELPRDRIAQQPLANRDASRLLHVAAAGGLGDHRFAELPSLLRPGDLLVANDTRVRRARLRGTTGGGRAVELLVLAHIEGSTFSCLARPARHLVAGTEVRIDAELRATVTAVAGGHEGERLVRFESAHGDVDGAIEAAGEPPLPPYIQRRLEDPERYQTVYASGVAASAAAPTAGLHFTPPVMRALGPRGIGWATVSLDVGLATFAPIRSERIDAHRMHRERFRLPAATAAAINRTRDSGGRVIAVGTTVVRVLESCAAAGGVAARAGSTELFIRPGHAFAVVDGLLTNFHQPRSSLLVLLAAFMGVERWRAAYAHALASGYRFLSFGDCMLCWRDA